MFLTIYDCSTFINIVITLNIIFVHFFHYMDNVLVTLTAKNCVINTITIIFKNRSCRLDCEAPLNISPSGWLQRWLEQKHKLTLIGTYKRQNYISQYCLQRIFYVERDTCSAKVVFKIAMTLKMVTNNRI